ncbi:MAG TPA: T9SS type A sorting domain-containing protein [Prolixibacteraceae bacterium]|jgi:hypothetical protein
MEPKILLLFLFWLFLGSTLDGQEKPIDNLLITPGQTDAYLGSITWPDIPASFKGDLAGSFGWKGDTIPYFNPLTLNYVLILPPDYQQIPALTFSTRHPNTTVKVTRAKSLCGSIADRTITFTVTSEDSSNTNVYSVLLKTEQDTTDSEPQQSVVYSSYYKVSAGTSLKETIQGVPVGTTVAAFYQHITRADELQRLKVISAASGAELAQADAISRGDTLVVLSADNSQTTKYLLELTLGSISPNTLLTSSTYTVSVSGSTGTISGFPRFTLLKKVLEGVVIPAGATLTMVDQHDAYMTLVKLNYDTVYVNVQATPAVYFEVIAENGLTKVVYQLMPSSNFTDAYVTSDLYSVDQWASLIQFVPLGTSVASLLSHVTPAPGATMAVFDKAGLARHFGILSRDDKLEVLSKDGKLTKVYYFNEQGYWGSPFQTYVISDDYKIDQVSHCIYEVSEGTGIAEFKSKLYPSFGASLQVMDASGRESTLASLSPGDQLLVTSADGAQTATYSIAQKTGVDPVYTGPAINIGPNPSTGQVLVQGLAKGNRIRVLNLAGSILQEVMTEHSSQTISLDAQPAGIYLLAVYAGSQQVYIQKIVKK